MQRPITPNPYKARLAALGLTQASILPNIRLVTGMCINAGQLCNALSGVGVQPKHQRIREAVESLLTELESKQKEEKAV